MGPLAALLITGLAFLIVLWKWFENMAARYDICQDRLIVRRGIFIKSLDEVELYRVKDVRLDFSLINQMAGIGTITVTSSDETTRGGAAHPAPRRARRPPPRGAAPPGRGRPPETPRARDRHDARGLLKPEYSSPSLPREGFQGQPFFATPTKAGLSSRSLIM